MEPEISYKHFGIIFKTDNRHVYAIPITSFKQDNPKHISAYHPTTNPTGDKTYIRINSSEFPFLQHDSVVKAEEMKLISTKRIISVCGSISSNTELKEVLSSYLFDYLFPDKADMLDRNQRENSLLKMKLFLSEAEREYSIKSPEDLRTLLNIPADYNYQLIDTEPEKTEDKPHMSTFILRDVYQQTISKALLIKYKA